MSLVDNSINQNTSPGKEEKRTQTIAKNSLGKSVETARVFGKET